MNINKYNEENDFTVKKLEGDDISQKLQRLQTTISHETLAQAESLLQYLEQTANGIGLYENLDKTEFMWFE